MNMSSRAKGDSFLGASLLVVDWGWITIEAITGTMGSSSARIDKMFFASLDLAFLGSAKLVSEPLRSDELEVFSLF